jgi:hypothetical protein
MDPIFGIGCGLAATALRIQREQREKFPDQDSSFAVIWQKGQRYNRIYWASVPDEKTPS